MRKCVFCGATAGNREHVYPDWLSKQYGDIDARVEIDQDKGIKYEFNAKIFQQTVKSVCQKCNNGWMSKIENGVKDFLGDMALGKNYPVSLDLSMQYALALWAQKTFLILQSTFPVKQRNVSEAMYEQMYTRKEVLFASATLISFNQESIPTPGSHVAGMRAFQITNATIPKGSSEEFKSRIQNHRFIVRTVRLGAISFHMILTDMENIQFGFSNSLRDFLQLISPTPEHDVIEWPTTLPAELTGGWEVIQSGFVKDLAIEEL